MMASTANAKERSAMNLLTIAGFKEHEIEVLSGWNATKLMGRLREGHLSILYLLRSMANDSRRSRIPVKNLIIVARRGE
jgi:hypothetical protein